MPRGVHGHNKRLRMDKLRGLIKASRQWIEQAEQQIRTWEAELALIEAGAYEAAQYVRTHPEDIDAVEQMSRPNRGTAGDSAPESPDDLGT